MSLLKQIV